MCNPGSIQDYFFCWRVLLPFMLGMWPSTKEFVQDRRWGGGGVGGGGGRVKCQLASATKGREKHQLREEGVGGGGGGGGEVLPVSIPDVYKFNLNELAGLRGRASLYNRTSFEVQYYRYQGSPAVSRALNHITG